MTWFHSIDRFDSKCTKSFPLTTSIVDLILHINMTLRAWLVPQLNASNSFFTRARFFGRQAVACPLPLLSTSKPFLAIFTISSLQVICCFESSNQFYTFHFCFHMSDSYLHNK
jgi:hypothetical protein